MSPQQRGRSWLTVTGLVLVAWLVAACGQSELPPVAGAGRAVVGSAPTADPHAQHAPAKSTPVVRAAPVAAAPTVRVVSVLRGAQVPWGNGTMRTRDPDAKEALVITYEPAVSQADKLVCGTVRDGGGQVFSSGGTRRPTDQQVACLFSIPKGAAKLTWRVVDNAAPVELDGLIKAP